jgi:rhodanese-related sulfurtransferase
MVDDNGVRATMTASWLKQMGWLDIAVLVAGPADCEWTTGPHLSRIFDVEIDAALAIISVEDLRKRQLFEEVEVVDLDLSTRYARGHIPGAWFAIRSRLGTSLSRLPAGRTIVLTSADGKLAALATAELRATATTPVLTLAGGTQAWVAAGLPLETGATRMADQADDVHLMPRERGQDREAAMREYLTWEVNLADDMAKDDDHRFHLVDSSASERQ